MSNNKKESAVERLERMKREKEASREARKDNPAELVSQLTHESTGEPDFGEIARKLEERKAQEATGGANDGYVKMTLYVREDLARSFDALVSRHGQKKEYINQAIQDFVAKKARELGL